MPEITLDDEFGRAIASTIRHCGIRSVIEIGSWDGSGSTSVIIQALQPAPEKRLTCVEANPERHAALQRVTAPHSWVETVCSRSVSRATQTPQAFRQVWESPFNRLRYPQDEVERWWNEQRDGRGYLDSLTDERWDAALIDGCEFCGWDDYRLLRDRVKVLMLDDVFHAYKCAQAHEDLRRRVEWECIWSSAFVRNGAAIWMRAA